jgi:hypothetical protein
MQRLNRTIKDSFMKTMGPQCRLDAVIRCLYHRVSRYYHARTIMSDKAAPGLGRSKRLRYYEDRLKSAADLFEHHREDVLIDDPQLGVARVRRRSAQNGTEDNDEDSFYTVDLSSASCSCQDVFMVVCKHILCVSMCLPDAADRFRINCDTIRASVIAPGDENDLEEYLRDRAQLEEEEEKNRTVPRASTSSADVGVPFLMNHEGKCVLFTAQTNMQAAIPSCSSAVPLRVRASAIGCAEGNRQSVDPAP